MVTNCTLVMS